MSKTDVIWDNTNIAESYPGVSLPLTFSFIKNAYANVYKNFLLAVGVSGKRVQDSASIYSNLLGHIHGHVYYNALNWYEMIKLLPGYAHNKEFLESMWNPAKKLQAEKTKLKLATALRLAPSLLFFMYKIYTVRWKVAPFVEYFKQKYDVFSLEPIGGYSLVQLADRYRRLEETFFSAWSVPIINDFRVMIFHGLLKRIVSRVHPENSA